MAVNIENNSMAVNILNTSFISSLSVQYLLTDHCIYKTKKSSEVARRCSEIHFDIKTFKYVLTSW